MTHQNLSLGMYRKLFWATLNQLTSLQVSEVTIDNLSPLRCRVHGPAFWSDQASSKKLNFSWWGAWERQHASLSSNAVTGISCQAREGGEVVHRVGILTFCKKNYQIPTPGQRIIVKISRNKWFTSHLLFKIDRSNAWCQVKIATLGDRKSVV